MSSKDLPLRTKLLEQVQASAAKWEPQVVQS